MKIAYKAFEKDLSCTSGRNRFQYKENEWNVEPEANCVQNGFHCAENPLDCIKYYPVWENAVYYIVQIDGDIDEDGRDSKIACTKLKPIKKLTLEEFVYVSLMYMVHHPYRRWAYCVCKESGRANANGFVIVRGKNPFAAGDIGTVLGIIKEEIDSPQIKEMSIITIDGKEYLPEVYYTYEGRKKEL